MKILMLLKSPIDNDSRVKKEIVSLRHIGIDVNLISVNGMTLDGIGHHVFQWEDRRIILPGVSGFIFFIKFFLFAIRNYRGETVIHAHDLNTLPVAVVIRFLNRKSRIKIVYDSHEFAANDVPYESNISKRIKYINEWFWIRWCHHIITVSDSIAEKYSSVYQIEKPVVIHNCPSYQKVSYSNRFRKIFDIKGHDRIFLYQGALSKGRGIETLLEVFSVSQNYNAVIIFMGYGELTSIVKKYASKASNIFHHEAVPPEILMDYTSSADIGVALIDNSCISYNLCLPNKVFEYMMASLPVIVSDLPELRKLITSFNVGLVCQSNEFDDVTSVIELASAMDLSAMIENLEALNLNYNWEREAIKLKKIYKSNFHDVV